MVASRVPMKPNPTNRDLQHSIQEAHGCIHQVDGKVEMVDSKVEMLARALGVQLPTAEQVASGELPKVHRRLGGLRPWHAATIAVPVIAGGMTAYKVIEPAIVAFATALHHALMTVH